MPGIPTLLSSVTAAQVGEGADTCHVPNCGKREWRGRNSRRFQAQGVPCLPARDAAVPGGVLLHALRLGSLWMAHLPHEEAHMWTLSLGQILLVSTHPRHPFFPAWFPTFRNTLCFFLLVLPPCLISFLPFSPRVFFFPSLWASYSKGFLNPFQLLVHKPACPLLHPLWSVEQPVERTHLAHHQVQEELLGAQKSGS